MSLRKFFSRFKKTSVEQAQQRAALLQGEHTFATVMVSFYDGQVESINPHDDWWTFAEVKQKQVDMRAEQARLARACDEAQAQLTATKEATK